MFKIESYVTPILLSYVDKYVKDFKPANAQVSLWGGGVALHNLVLKADVLQKEVNLPFTLVSGRIHELLIQVPWTKIISEPIVVTIDTIECILSHPSATQDDNPAPESPSRKTQVVEAPPGYMQALVRRVVSNISLKVHHLIVKYVHDDIILSLNVKHLTVDSAGANWTPAFADIDQNDPVIRKLVRLDDLTLCLDRSDSDGKIRFYQEPLLYRCQLDFRVLTKLVSANTRRASSVSAELRSSKLAWGITSDQLVLLLRLLREPQSMPTRPSHLAAKTSSPSQDALHPSPSNSAEPTRTESWSEWAWSWVPNMDNEGGVEEAAPPTLPTPVHFSAYLDDVSLVFKVLDEDNNRKRARGILELNMAYAAIKSDICAPTTLRVSLDVHNMFLRSNGKCVCGHLNTQTGNDEPTIYLTKTGPDDDEFKWSENDFNYGTVEKAEIAEEFISETVMENLDETSKTASERTERQLGQEPPVDSIPPNEEEERKHERTSIIRVEFTHERSPPTPYANPYDNPPKHFEYSDWEEQCSLKIQVAPMEIRVCMGLIHRLAEIRTALAEGPPAPVADLPVRILTVEECDALLDNLPQRRINIEVIELRVRIYPWDHSLTDKLSKTPLVLELELPKVNSTIASPLYPHRVCTAACQMPEDTGPIWQGARLHVSAAMHSIQVNICDLTGAHRKPCVRADLRFVIHLLLNQQFFIRRPSITFSYSIKLRELNVSGSAARLQAATQVLASLINQRFSQPLRLTSLPKDALSDEDLVALDMTLEDLLMRGYLTNKTNTHILTMQSARATFFHAREGEDLKQAWLFSAPDVPSAAPYLRLAVQWCSDPFPSSLDYFGAWTEPTAICVDPLFISWLAYRPYYRPVHESFSANLSRSMSSGSSSFLLRRRVTPPSSSGRGASAEQVHVRPRSAESSSERSEKKENIKTPTKQAKREYWWSRENMLALHERLKHVLVSSELGLVLVYVTQATASAVDCPTVRQAMEQHAASHRVLALSVGRWSLHSNTMTKHLWQDIKHDGPTFVGGKAMNEDAFPWKMRLADVSCYIMEESTMAPAASKEKAARGLRSQLKVTHAINTRTILELVTTTITVSVVTKSLQYKTLVRKPEHKKYKEPTAEEAKMKYFTTGTDFKPTTLKEFVRGPVRRKQPTEGQKEYIPENDPVHKVTTGPMVSLGFHLHADTPPIIVRLDQDQVRVVGAALHCITHIFTLLRRAPLVITKQSLTTLNLGDAKSVTRSVTEIEELRSPTESIHDNNDIISIFETRQDEVKVHTFIWFQWVISRATLVVATYQVKLAFEVDDIISTVDLQEHYNQLRVKIASASIKNHERTDSGEWVPGAFKGRVMEAREPANAQEDNHFLSVTITQAQISNLPASWKEELHPKMFDPKYNPDTIWEVYASLAPLEVVLLPAVVENIIYVANEMAPKSDCSLSAEVEKKPVFQWPFCYINAGGLRIVVACREVNKDTDDTFVISVHKVTVNPYPENPISRRPINTGAENLLNVGGVYEGRQYEIQIKHVSIRSTQLSQLVHQEMSEADAFVVGGENPACKWTQPVIAPVLTYVLHPVDLGVVMAPPLFVGSTLAAGAGIEINFTSDCLVELGIHQIELLLRTLADIKFACRNRDRSYSEDFESRGACSYVSIFANKKLPEQLDYGNPSEATLVEESLETEQSRNAEADSGLDTVKSLSTLTMRKSVSVTFVEHGADPSDYLEVFVTMGLIDISLYAFVEDHKTNSTTRTSRFNRVPTSNKEAPEKDPNEDNKSLSSTTSLANQIRLTEAGATHIDLVHTKVRLGEGKMSLIHLILYQPNVYYNKMKWQKSVQVSLFNMWVGIDGGETENNSAFLTTARGVIDPVTEIPPALATIKYTSASGSTYVPSSGSARGSLTVDIERPVLLHVSFEILTRLQDAQIMIASKLMKERLVTAPSQPLAYKIRRLMMNHSIETITVQACQIGVTGSCCTAGWDGASLQVSWSARPERLVARASVSALMVAFGPPNDARHPVLQPLHLGAEIDATWDAWRRIEGGLSERDPITRIGVDLDRVVVDLRPEDLDAVKSVHESIKMVIEHKRKKSLYLEHINTPSVENITVGFEPDFLRARSSVTFDSTQEFVTFESNDADDHYYKDDLRSGAFNIVSGGQVPMAYQVLLHKNMVTWRYPHPRAITRIVAFPLLDQDIETECVLEMHNRILRQWEPLTYFNIPIDSPKEFLLMAAPPEAVFATTWRFRVTAPLERRPKFQFDMSRYVPNSEPLFGPRPAPPEHKWDSNVTAEQLSGVLRVDSYFSPRLLPILRVSIRVVALEVHAYNSLPYLSSQATALEGYYVSKPLMRCHRMFSIIGRDIAAYAQLGSPAGKLVLADAVLSSDVFDCASGIMEQMVDEFRLQAGLSLTGKGLEHSKVRTRASEVHVALHVPRMRTLQALVMDWKTAMDKESKGSETDRSVDTNSEKVKTKRELAAAAAVTLEGRVCLWIHNSCAAALRVGQEGTDEVVPLGPGARLAYRWRSPTAAKKLRFAFANPSAEWHWSHSIPFTVGESKVLVEESPESNNTLASGIFVHTSVKQEGANRMMRLSGRLVLANMLRFNILYKVRARNPNASTWQSIVTGELVAESVGRSVICHSNCDMALKVKFLNHNTGWSGDIPLKECPKENVPWLVKVPSEGEMPYISVWCRVVRARADGRMLATIWPLYVLHSHIPLDTDILVSTETGLSLSDVRDGDTRPAPLIQTAPGRGCSTHLLAPGTTSAKHTLSFQYRNIECPVTREAVPLHYGVTDTSVFDKRTPVQQIEEVIDEILQWLERSGRGATSTWPYSQVANHWPGSWQAALMQPRCDVSVRYRAVRAGGGCSLEVQLCPVLLLCNASPITLTLRAHDAAPLCKLEPGNVISPPSAVLHKPFFMSVEIGRETFVSGQLELANANPGQYGSPPPGQVAIGHVANFAIQCNQKATLLTLYYEIKEDINVLGITSTFVLFNQLKTDVLVSAIAVSDDFDKDVILRPKSFKVVPPTKDKNFQGVPLCRFWLHDRWRGGDACELLTFLCVSLSTDTYQSDGTVPVRLGMPPYRRAIALRDDENNSVAVVVTQHKHEGRWIITVANDPCPQYVVHNLTREPLCIAQPKAADDKATDSQIRATVECPGVYWWSTLGPGRATHYSSPEYCSRHPPPQQPTTPTGLLLTFARHVDGIEPDWCPPAAVVDGEHLVQLQRNFTVKMRVKLHPHSSLIELLDVGQADIAASDIRKRLIGLFISEDDVMGQETKLSVPNLSRVAANNKLPVRNEFLEKTLEEMQIHREQMTTKIAEQKEQSQPEDEKLSQSEENWGGAGHSGANEQPLRPRSETLAPEDRHDQSQPQNHSASDSDHLSILSPIISRSAQIKISEPDKDHTSNPELAQKDESKKDDSTVATLLVQEEWRGTRKPDESNDTNIEQDIQLGTNGSDLHEELKTSKCPSPEHSDPIITHHLASSDVASTIFRHSVESELEDRPEIVEDRFRCAIERVMVEFGGAGDTKPLLAVHADRVALHVSVGNKRISTSMSVADVQVDNRQYESGQFDFAVLASTRSEPLQPDGWTPLWNIFSENEVFSTRQHTARLLLRICSDKWNVVDYHYNEITELDVRLGPLALYVEDAYIKALIEVAKQAFPPSQSVESPLAEARSLQKPLMLRLLQIQPLDLTLTLHTAYRMYIALDHSPLHLNEFKLTNVMTSRERLAHALTVHYLSAAILGAGWVVGGLELLGAPGALAARVGGATGGVRGVASAAAAALLTSLSALASSLARNLDILAGDEEHARRAAALRRRPPDSLMAGLVAGLTNFAVNILGAVGGLAHHPLVGVAVGESDSGAQALRRGLLGAFTKPLSATADLVAYAGHGLLRQAGWDPVPQPRTVHLQRECSAGGWRRDCVRWAFRLAELSAFAGFEVLMNGAPLLALLTQKFLVIADSETERIVEMIDFKFCSVGPYQGPVIELTVTQRRSQKVTDTRVDEDDEFQISAAAMARVARYTGAAAGTSSGGAAAAAEAGARTLVLLPRPAFSHALHAALIAAAHHNDDSHFSFL